MDAKMMNLMMRQMMPEIGACADESERLHKILSDSQELVEANCTVKPKQDDSYCFHVVTPRRGLSVSVPPDTNRWHIIENVASPFVYEIALTNKDYSGLKYDASLGYEDICRFGSSDKIITEIVRLSTANSVDESVPESESDSDSEPDPAPPPPPPSVPSTSKEDLKKQIQDMSKDLDRMKLLLEQMK